MAASAMSVNAETWFGIAVTPCDMENGKENSWKKMPEESWEEDVVGKFLFLPESFVDVCLVFLDVG